MYLCVRERVCVGVCKKQNFVVMARVYVWKMGCCGEKRGNWEKAKGGGIEIVWGSIISGKREREGGREGERG